MPRKITGKSYGASTPPRGAVGSRRNREAAAAKNTRQTTRRRVRKQQLKDFIKKKTDKMLEADVNGNQINPLTPTNKLPLAFLYDVYNSPRYLTADRISAAKACLPYLHKRLPIEVNQGGAEVTRLRPEDLEALSDEELLVFEAILRKLKSKTSGPLDPGQRFLEDMRRENIYDEE
jgi:hypothetical protein